MTDWHDMTGTEPDYDGPLRVWTDEELLRIQLYGRCVICGEPRQLHRFIEDFEGGRQVETTALACPNGPHGTEWPLTALENLTPDLPEV